MGQRRATYALGSPNRLGRGLQAASVDDGVNRGLPSGPTMIRTGYSVKIESWVIREGCMAPTQYITTVRVLSTYLIGAVLYMALGAGELIAEMWPYPVVGYDYNIDF